MLAAKTCQATQSRFALQGFPWQAPVPQGLRGIGACQISHLQGTGLSPAAQCRIDLGKVQDCSVCKVQVCPPLAKMLDRAGRTWYSVKGFRFRETKRNKPKTAGQSPAGANCRQFFTCRRRAGDGGKFERRLPRKEFLLGLFAFLSSGRFFLITNSFRLGKTPNKSIRR